MTHKTTMQELNDAWAEADEALWAALRARGWADDPEIQELAERARELRRLQRAQVAAEAAKDQDPEPAL